MDSPDNRGGNRSPEEKRRLVRERLRRNDALREARPETGPTSAAGNVQPVRTLEEFPEYRHWADLRERLERSGIADPFFRAQDGPAGAEVGIGGRNLVNFSGYDYLALASHPEVSDAARQAIDRYGTSASASRIVSGERPLHRKLEAALSDWIGTEDCLALVSGFGTNVTILGHLFGPRDVILHDALAHNSIIQGACLAGARRIPFPHNDWRRLREILRDVRDRHERAVIVIEGVYSMDGDFPDLPEFVTLAKEFGTFLMVDEAHSTGVMGAAGRGIGEHFGVDPSEVDLWMGTLSKALASCGGYLGGSLKMIRYLRNTLPGFIYSVGMSPPDTAAALAALGVLRAEPERVERLRRNSELFLELAREHGLDTGNSGGSAVVPVILGDSKLCLQLAEALFRDGINVHPILHPAVEEKATRLRFFLNTGHTETMIRNTIEALTRHLARLASPSGAEE